MKLSLIIAGLALSTQARRFNPKALPEDMEGENQARFTVDDDGKKVGSDALDYEASGATAYCLRESKAFDKYCHQYNPGKKLKYADFTDGGDVPSEICAEWEDDGAPTTESVYCLAQDCMFDYCLWRRDEQLDACEDFVEDWEAAVQAATDAADGVDQCAKRKMGVCVRTLVDVIVGEGE